MIEKVAVVIPVYNPEPALGGLCADLSQRFKTVVVVDDGSVENTESFSKLPSRVILLRHEKNMGKGAAIKTALRYLDSAADAESAVFADGDGQHLVKDIEAVARKAVSTNNVVFGVRNFNRPGIPFRSRLGNLCTSFLVHMLKGIKICDTQTGLRAVPRRLFASLAKESGDRYEFEMKMFDFLKRKGEAIEQVGISTVYLDSNRASHFNPIADSFRVYNVLFGGMFLKFCGSSLTSFALDNFIFTGILLLLQGFGFKREYNILTALVAARFVSATFNYFCNFKFVFKSGGRMAVSYARYWELVFLIAGLSYAGTSSLSAIAEAAGCTITAIKVSVETVLFALSYKLQRNWVFNGRDAAGPEYASRPKIPFNAAELALIGVMLSVALANLLLVCGFRLSPAPLWCGIIAACIAARMKSYGTLAGIVAIYAAACLSAVCVESYSATDSMRAYFPMQRILAEGWNPFYGLDTETICAYAGTPAVAAQHIQFCPSMTAEVAAMVDNTFGILSGDCFLGVILACGLFSAAYRFGMLFWHSRLGAVLLASAAALSPKVSSFMSGHVDYTVYAFMMITAFSSAAWIDKKRKQDLMLSLLGCFGALAGKATGVPFAAVFFMAIAAFSRRKTGLYKLLLAGLAGSLVFGSTPYLVNCLASGSPFPPNDITSDFTGNADALRMGYWMRLAYAWVSPGLACSIGKVLYHADFAPVFALNSDGYGTAYRFLLLISTVSLCLTKKNAVALMCVLLFLTGNLLPVKYIGYARYCPQLYIIPFVAITNGIVAARQSTLKGMTGSAVRKAAECVWVLACAAVACIILFMSARSIAYACRCHAWNSAREIELAKMRRISSEWRLKDDITKCAMIKFMQWNGMRVVDDPSAPEAAFNVQYNIVSASPLEDSRIKAFFDRFPICASPKALMLFDWKGALDSPCF